MESGMQRERLGSRLGFILLSVGCAIGIGNVWKFPYIVGQNGGGIFVLIYIFFLAIIGVPVLTMEFSLGRAAQKSPVRLYQELEPKGSKWHIHGYFSLIGSYLLMMFYTTVTAWMLMYFIKSAQGEFAGADAEAVKQIFSKVQGNPLPLVLFVGIVVFVGFGVCAIGVQKGLERITKVMMLILLSIMIILAVHSITLEGGAEGLKFYLKPDFQKMKEIGVGEVIVQAMNQAFFTLSLGLGSMAILGSYIGKERALLGEAVNVAVLDTFVAFVAGLIIFPACLAYGVQPDSGPGLIFITLPNIFNHLAGGRFWGSMFFVFMSFAALSTVFAVFENIVSCVMDLTNWSRKKSCLINGIVMFFLSLPCIFGFSQWKGFQPLGAGSNIMDLEDFLVSNFLLPIGSLIFILFCVCRYGWGWKNFTAEANSGKGLKIQNWMRGYITFVLPIVTAVIFVVGLVGR